MKNYLHNTSNSYAAHRAAEEVIPGGVQGNIKAYPPYPLSFSSANGAFITDVDGNEYVDYLLSFGALILGHGHPVVKEAVDEAWSRYGTSSFGVPYDLELAMVERMRGLYPSLEMVRFTNSGLEATLLAVRLGLAYTGRRRIAKFLGHYHGGHEHVLVNTTPQSEDGRPIVKHAESLGLPDYFVNHTEILPFQDIDLCERILREQKDEIGIVILEPFQSGYIATSQAFMNRLREITEELGMVLVFDEVKTGFRIRLGGAQEYYGVRPDLTALGKVLGGGFPIGAVGGRQEIMELASPGRSSAASEVVFHSGTFNGNPMSLLAGLRTIDYLSEPGVYETLLGTTQHLREEIEAIGRHYELPMKTVGTGTIFNVIFGWLNETCEEPRDIVRAEQSSQHRDRRQELDFLLMKHGVFSKPYNRFSMSVAHDALAIQKTIDAFTRSAAALQSSLVSP